MFLVDDVVLAPIHGLLWIFRTIRDAAEEEVADEADSITAELSELYMRLETGRITEAEFEARERVLLDRLEAIQRRAGDSESSEDDSSEDGGGPRD
jgi:hypothetical protein